MVNGPVELHGPWMRFSQSHSYTACELLMLPSITWTPSKLTLSLVAKVMFPLTVGQFLPTSSASAALVIRAYEQSTVLAPKSPTQTSASPHLPANNGGRSEHTCRGEEPSDKSHQRRSMRDHLGAVRPALSRYSAQGGCSSVLWKDDEVVQLLRGLNCIWI